MAKADVRKPGEILIGDKVNTPDGVGKVSAVTDDIISVDLDSKKKGQFKPRYISLA